MSDNEIKDYGPRKTVVNATVQWPDMRLSEQVKHVRLFRDSENNIVAMPVILLDPTQTGLNVLPMGRVGISDPTTLNSYARVFGLPCCGWPESTLGLVTHSTEMVQKDANLEAVRTPTTFRTALANAIGNTLLWDPAAGRRFRLLGGIVTIPNIATSVGGVLSTLTDGAAAMNITMAYIGATTNGVAYSFTLGPNGFLSAAVDNILYITNTAAYTAAGVQVSVYGTEEV